MESLCSRAFLVVTDRTEMSLPSRLYQQLPMEGREIEVSTDLIAKGVQKWRVFARIEGRNDRVVG